MINKEATNDRPAINFNSKTHVLYIAGNSYPENCSSVYDPIKSFIENYNIAEQKDITLHCHFNLLNSTSSVHVAQLIMLIAEKKEKGLEANIIWTYDEHDEEMLDLGEKLASISKMDIEFRVEIENEI